MKKSFPERLKALRGQKSQAEFAKMFGLSQTAYGRYELGTREPSLGGLTQIAQKLDVSIDWLLGLSESKASPKPGGLKKNVRHVHDLADKMTVKTNDLLSLTEEMEKALSRIKDGGTP